MNERRKYRPDWIQLGILVLSLVVFWYGAHRDSTTATLTISERVSKLEQRFDDADKDRALMLDSLARIEARLRP